MSNDGTLRIWDVSDATANGLPTRRLLATFNVEAGDAVTVASLPADTDATATDNPAVVTGHGDGRVRLWDWRRLDAFIQGQRAYQRHQRANAVSPEQ